MYSYRKHPRDGVTDVPYKNNDHLMDTWRYAAQCDLKYVKPRPPKRVEGYTNKALKAKRERARARNDSGWGESIKLG